MIFAMRLLRFNFYDEARLFASALISMHFHLLHHRPLHQDPRMHHCSFVFAIFIICYPITLHVPFFFLLFLPLSSHVTPIVLHVPFFFGFLLSPSATSVALAVLLFLFIFIIFIIAHRWCAPLLFFSSMSSAKSDTLLFLWP